MKTLTIRLTAPLQSYGNEATFERRTSGDYPSKSAVIGMIAAALGYGREDKRILALNDLSFAVRTDQPGTTLTDYQTVEWKKNTRKITYRDYVQDAVFVVAIGSGDDDFIAKIKAALRAPHFPLFLGRRSNAPAGVLKIEEFSELDPVTALEKFDWQASSWYQQKHHKQAAVTVEIIADADLLAQSSAPATMVKDRVISFDQRDRRHGFRAVATKRISLRNPYFREADTTTDHDVINFL